MTPPIRPDRLAQLKQALEHAAPSDATSTRGTQQRQLVQGAADATRAMRDHTGRALAAADSVPSLVLARYGKYPEELESAEAQDARPDSRLADSHRAAQYDSSMAAQQLAHALMALAGRHGFSGVGEPDRDPTNEWSRLEDFPRGPTAPPLPISPARK